MNNSQVNSSGQLAPAPAKNKTAPISLGSYLVTRVNFPITNTDYFMRKCNWLANIKSLLPSEIADFLIGRLKLKQTDHYSNLTELIDNWKNDVK